MLTARHSFLLQQCGVVLFTLAGATAAEPPPFSGAVRFGSGYDDGALIVPELLALDSGVSGISTEAQAQLDWQALRNPGGRLDVVAHGGYRQVDGQALEELRAGGGVSGTGALGASAVTTTLDGEQRWLNHAELAWNVGLTLGIALPFAGQVALPELEVRNWRFAERPAESGVLVAARYRHWMPLTDGDPRRRAELGIEGSRYQTDSDATTYNGARIDAGVRERVGPQRGAGRWDISASGWYEFRDYRSGTRERQLSGLSGTCDRWFNAWMAVGLALDWERLADQPGGVAFTQFQASLRATAAF